MPSEQLEWRLEAYKGWAIEYPIITDPDGTKYTPLDIDHWRTRDISLLP